MRTKEARYRPVSRPRTRSLTPIKIVTRSGLTRWTSASSLSIRSRVVYPLTAGLVTSTSPPACSVKRPATIDGQLCEGFEAPVPIVYESPRARYLIAKGRPPTRPCPAGRADLPGERGGEFLALPIDVGE